MSKPEGETQAPAAWLLKVAWLPVMLFLGATILLWIADIRTCYESPHLLMFLNVFFIILVALFTVCLVSCSFLARGEPGLLLLGSGIMIWCASGVLTVGCFLMPGTSLERNPNTLITIHNSCAWAASLCHLSCAALSTRCSQKVQAPALWLTVAYACALAAALGIAFATVSGSVPVFFVQGEGGTLIRYLVLGTAVVMFAMAAALLRGPNRAGTAPFVQWYTLALLLFAIGLTGIMMQPCVGSPLGWAGRAAQYLGGAYMLAASLAALRTEGVRNITLGKVCDEMRFRYIVAITSACSAAVIRLTFLSSLGTRVTYLTFYPAVMLAALYGGFRAGLLATVLCAGLADYFLIEPFGSLAVSHPSDLLGIAVFLLTCSGLSLIAESMHRAHRRAALSEAELQHTAELMRNEQLLRTLNRTLLALNHSGKALARATDEASLLKEVCRIIVEDCDHTMVWIGFAEDDADKSIRPAAYSGFEEGYLETLKLTWADTARGRGPTGLAIRTGKVSVCRDMLTDPSFAPWREEALRRGYASSIALPLQCGNRVIGALTLYSRRPDTFSNKELDLLTELSSDLAFGIFSLRLRQAHLEAEAENKRSQRERDLTIAFLRMVNLSKNMTDLLQTASQFFKEHAGCDAVGIRLRKGNDFPYCQTLGFSDTFLESEMTLCTCREAKGASSLACLCGKVINGHTDPKAPTFTSHGSFWSNDSSTLLRLPQDDQGLIRGKCIQEGYGSIALLPLHEGQSRLGLVQLNAWRKEAFTPEAVSLWERLSGHLAVAVAKFQAEEALRDSEALNRQTLQALPAHIAVIDRSGRVVVVNEAWLDFARDNDASESDAVKVGSNYLDTCRRSAATNDAGAVQALAGIEEVIAGARKQFSLEYPCHSPNKQRWFLMTVTPFDATGAVITHLDITSQKQAEIARQNSLEELRDSRLAALGLMQDAVEARRHAEQIGAALQASEQRIQQALHVSHSFTFEWVPATDLVLRSASCGSILDLTGDESCHDTGERFFQRVHTDDRARFLQVLHGLTPAAPSYLVEYRVTRGDGTTVVLEETGQATFSEAGELQRVVGVTTDITAHKKAEQQLFETTQRLQALMAAVPVGISFSDDATCQHVSGNPAVLAQFEVSPEENLSASATLADAPGRQVKFFSRGEPITEAELPLQRAVAENRMIRPVELEVLLPSGKRWFADASGAPVRDAQGNVIGGIAVTVDITERKRAEEVLRFLGQCGTNGSSEDFFHALARYLAQALAMDFVCIDRLADDQLSAQTLAVFHNGHFEDNVSYTLKDTPCGDVVGRNICCFPQNVRKLFAKDVVLQELQAESYLGTTLWSSQGKPIGLIAVIGQQPLADTRRAESLLQMVGVRAAGELERQQAETEVRTSRRRAELLAQTASELLAKPDPQRVIESLCHDVLTFLDCHVFFNFLVDEHTGRLHLNAYAGIPEQEVPGIEWLDYGVAVCGCVAQEGQRIIAEDIFHTADRRTDLVKSYGVQAYCCHPLLSQNKVLGTLSFGTRSRTTFSEDDVSMMKSIADLVAMAMSRLRDREILRESQEDLNRAQVVAHVGSWRLNVLRNELYWSDENWRIFGVPKGTPLTYETFLHTIHPDDRTYVHEKWSAALRGEPYDIEHRIVVDGAVKWVRERAELEFDSSDTLLGGFGTTQDITERKLAETVNARYELIAQYARDPLLLVDLDGNIIEANQAAVKLYGYPKGELLKLRLHALRQDDAEVVDLQMQSARAHGVLFESVHVCKDGVCVPVEVSARGVVVEGKEMLLSVIRDIRQRKETELSLRRAKEDAERASQAKSDFLASMSHELRTPLNAIMGFSQVLENGYFGALGNKQKEYVNDIYESGKHLLSLINDILELSKIEAGKMEPRWSRVNVGSLLEHSYVFVKERCFKQDIRLDFEIDEPVRELNIRADERRFKQIMYNLLSNAAKFTPNGGSIRVWARLLKGDKPALEISVSDTGIGIAPEHHERVFEAFYQVHQGTLNKTPGTGLGLSLVKQLVAMHGGQVWLTSEGEGRGSRFTFVIPAVDLTAEETPEGAP